MNTKQIEEQMGSIMDHLGRADHGRHPTGNLIIAITKLVDINRGLVTRIERLESAASLPTLGDPKKEKTCTRCGGTQFQAAPTHTGLCAKCWQRQYGSLDRQIEIDMNS